MSALSWLTAATRLPAADGVSPSGQQHAKGFPVGAAGWQHLMLLLVAECLSSGTDRIDRVGLGAAAAGRALGPGDLDDPLPMQVQERGQPGAVPAAVPAGALDRPTAPRPVAGDVDVGERQQLLVASGSSLGHGLGEDPTDRADGGSRQVSRWVSTPMTPSTVPATVSARDGHAVAPSGAAVVGVGLGGVTARHNSPDPKDHRPRPRLQLPRLDRPRR
jgi:hypothetical protein